MFLFGSLGLLLTFFYHLFFIGIAVLLFISIGKFIEVKEKYILVILLILDLSVYGYSLYHKAVVDEDAAQKQVGVYQLSNYPDCIDCLIELYPNHNFQVRVAEKIIENGIWEYFDDRDIAYIDFKGKFYREAYRFK